VGAEELRAAVYTRVSTESQGERGTSLESQLADCRKLAAELGADIVAEYQDIDSGASWELPGLIALMDAAKAKAFDTLIVLDPDRLARKMTKQLVLMDDFDRLKIALRYVNLRVGDTSEDRLLINMRAAIAEYEREKIAWRTTRGRYAKAEQGLVVGTGIAPYGYRYTRKTDEQGHTKIVGLELDPVTAPIAERILRALQHESADAVAASLNTDGIKPVRAEWWGAGTIQDIAHNPVYYGAAAFGRKERHGKTITDRGTEHWRMVSVPPIVSRSLWDAVQEALNHRRVARSGNKSHRETADVYTLRGLLTCAHCGGHLATGSDSRTRYYSGLRSLPACARVRDARGTSRRDRGHGLGGCGAVLTGTSGCAQDVQRQPCRAARPAHSSHRCHRSRSRAEAHRPRTPA
jgi:site-specific DNA recombinase